MVTLDEAGTEMLLLDAKHVRDVDKSFLVKFGMERAF